VNLELLTVCHGQNGEPNTSIYGKHAATEILNPTQNYTYEFFKDFFQEVRNVFKDDYIHLGKFLFGNIGIENQIENYFVMSRRNG